MNDTNISVVPVDADELHYGTISANPVKPNFFFIHEIVDGDLVRRFAHITALVSGVPVSGAHCTFKLDPTHVRPGMKCYPVKEVNVEKMAVYMAAKALVASTTSSNNGGAL